jgi:hypothetical protein
MMEEKRFHAEGTKVGAQRERRRLAWFLVATDNG